MPFKSKAQMRKFFAMEARGELPKGTARRWAHETKTPIKKLPERKKKRCKKAQQLVEVEWLLKLRKLAHFKKVAAIANGNPAEVCLHIISKINNVLAEKRANALKGASIGRAAARPLSKFLTAVLRKIAPEAEEVGEGVARRILVDAAAKAHPSAYFDPKAALPLNNVARELAEHAKLTSAPQVAALERYLTILYKDAASEALERVKEGLIPILESYVEKDVVGTAAKINSSYGPAGIWVTITESRLEPGIKQALLRQLKDNGIDVTTKLDSGRLEIIKRALRSELDMHVKRVADTAAEIENAASLGEIHSTINKSSLHPNVKQVLLSRTQGANLGKIWEESLTSVTSNPTEAIREVTRFTLGQRLSRFGGNVWGGVRQNVVSPVGQSLGAVGKAVAKPVGKFVGSAARTGGTGAGIVGSLYLASKMFGGGESPESGGVTPSGGSASGSAGSTEQKQQAENSVLTEEDKDALKRTLINALAYGGGGLLAGSIGGNLAGIDPRTTALLGAALGGAVGTGLTSGPQKILPDVSEYFNESPAT